MLLSRSDQAISATELQKNTKVILDNLISGEQDRYVVMRDNIPTGVLLPTSGYEALMTELETLRHITGQQSGEASCGPLQS